MCLRAQLAPDTLPKPPGNPSGSDLGRAPFSPPLEPQPLAPTRAPTRQSRPYAHSAVQRWIWYDVCHVRLMRLWGAGGADEEPLRNLASLNPLLTSSLFMAQWCTTHANKYTHTQRHTHKNAYKKLRYLGIHLAIFYSKQTKTKERSKSISLPQSISVWLLT